MFDKSVGTRNKAANAHGLLNCIERPEVTLSNCKCVERTLPRECRPFFNAHAFATFPVPEHLAIHYWQLAGNEQKVASLHAGGIQPGRGWRLGKYNTKFG